MNRLLTFICLILANHCCSQTLTVLSEQDRNPVAFAPVKLTPVNHTLPEQQYLTDTNGIITIDPVLFNLPIRIISSAVGFETLTDTTVLTDKQIIYLKPKKMQLQTVVITGQYAPNSIEKAVHQIKLIDRKKIEAMAAQNLKDVLTNELNIRLSQDNVLGSSMSLQGISGQNVKLLIDGVPVTGRLNGNIDISQINMNNVAKIEIVEGPMSVNYGSDALAGTINIITRKTQQEAVSVSSGNYYESNGQYNFSGRVGLRNVKNSIAVSGGRNYFDGWRTTDEPFLIEKKSLADSSRYMNWKPKEQYFATVNYMRFLPLKQGELALGYTGDYFKEDILNRGLPRLPYYETAFDDQYHTRRITNSVNLQGALNKNHYLQLLGAFTNYQRIKNTFYKDLTTLTQTLTENPGDQDTSVFNTITTRGSISSTRKNKFNYEIGYDVNHEKSLGIRIKKQKQQIGDYALFTSAEYHFSESMTVRPGLRFIYNTSYKAPVVPSIHIRYAANKGNILRFSYARGFRSPSLKELYFYFVDINHNIVGNEHLKAEHSHSFNLSFTSTHTGEQAICKIEASAFYNMVQQMIALAQISGTQYTYFNIDKIRTTGIQLQNEMEIRKLKITIGGAYTGRYNQLSSAAANQKFLFSPEGKCAIQYAFEKQGVFIALFYKYTGALPSYFLNSNNEIQKATMEDYHLADCSVSKTLFKNRIRISTGVKNIMDVTNVNGLSTGDAHTSSENQVTVGMGRTYFIKLDFNFTSKK